MRSDAKSLPVLLILCVLLIAAAMPLWFFYHASVTSPYVIDEHFRDHVEEVAYRKWIHARQQKWIGVQAPELPADATDRVTTPIRLSDYRGQRVLLYGFYAGNFVFGVDRTELLGQLQAVKHARAADTKTNLAVIGFSADPGLFPRLWGHTEADLDPTLATLTDFPLVLISDRAWPEPYDPLLKVANGGGWGALLIDRSGVILRIYNAPLKGEQLEQALRLPDWKGTPRPIPGK
jgi:alkyl hydroperoxide reductase subunit AhpC